MPASRWPSRRAAVDRALGRSGGGPAPTAEELAYHWDAAGDDRRALAATIEAGRAAERVYAWLDGHRHYLRAIELWERVGDAAAAGVDRPNRAHGARGRDRHPDRPVPPGGRAGTIRHREASIRPPSRSARPPFTSASAGTCGKRATGLRRPSRWPKQNGSSRPEPPSAARARILAHKAGIMLFGGRLAESVPVAEEAISVAREVGSAADEALGLGILGWASRSLGRVDEGVDRLRAGLAIAEAIHSAEGIALGVHEPCHPARPGRPHRRCARRGRRRLGAGPLARRRTDLRRPAARDRGEGRHRPRSLGRGGASPATGPVARSGSVSPSRTLAIQRCDSPRGVATSCGADAAIEVLSRSTGQLALLEDRAASLAALAELAAIGGRATDARGFVDQALDWSPDGPPDPALAQLAATGLRVEADAAAAPAARDEAPGRGAAPGGADRPTRRRIAATLGAAGQRGT